MNKRVLGPRSRKDLGKILFSQIAFNKRDTHFNFFHLGSYLPVLGTLILQWFRNRHYLMVISDYVQLLTVTEKYTDPQFVLYEKTKQNKKMRVMKQTFGLKSRKRANEETVFVSFDFSASNFMLCQIRKMSWFTFPVLRSSPAL